MTPRNTDTANAFCTVARVVEDIAYLPAVATHDWCERVARILFTLRPDAIVCVTIAQIDDTGSITHMECDGLADGNKPNSSLEAGLLRFDAQPALGWPPTLTGGEMPWADVLSQTSAINSFSESRVGRRWSDLGVIDLLVGVMDLPSTTNNRFLVTEFGVRSGAEPFGDIEGDMLEAVLPTIANRAMRAFGRDVSNPNNRVTPKEQIILEHLALGQTVKQIAATLERSPHTVHDHVKSLHRKLNATSRGELVARMLGHIDASEGEGTIRIAKVKPSTARAQRTAASS